MSNRQTKLVNAPINANGKKLSRRLAFENFVVSKDGMGRSSHRGSKTNGVSGPKTQAVEPVGKRIANLLFAFVLAVGLSLPTTGLSAANAWAEENLMPSNDSLKQVAYSEPNVNVDIEPSEEYDIHPKIESDDYFSVESMVSSEKEETIDNDFSSPVLTEDTLINDYLSDTSPEEIIDNDIPLPVSLEVIKEFVEYFNPNIDSSGMPGTPSTETVENVKVIDESSVLLGEGGGLKSPAVWYTVEGDVEVNEPIVVDGNVNLILEDGAILKANAGIQVKGTSNYSNTDEKSALTIWAQSDKDSGNTGRLIADGSGYRDPEKMHPAAGIGRVPDSEYIGQITIYGGDITAIGQTMTDLNGSLQGAPGIEGGYSGNGYGHRISLLGGKINAVGGHMSAGFGGGSYKNSFYATIAGSADVTATGSNGGAGIGGGAGAAGCDISIYGNARVNAQGGTGANGASGGAGIGGGSIESGIRIKIYGNADVTAKGYDGAAGIGGGAGVGKTENYGGEIEIYGNSHIDAAAIGGGGAGIGNGALYRQSGTYVYSGVTIYGNADIKATGGVYTSSSGVSQGGAGIGGGHTESYSNATARVMIRDNARITAESVSGADAIGMGTEPTYADSTRASVTIYGGTITAYSKSGVAFSNAPNFYGQYMNHITKANPYSPVPSEEMVETGFEPRPVFDWRQWRWVKISPAYVAVFDLQNGADPICQYYEEAGSFATKPDPDPVYKKHVFEGWYRDPSFEDEWRFDEYRLDQPLTYIYAKWSQENWDGKAQYYDPAITNADDGSKIVGNAGTKTMENVRMVADNPESLGESNKETWYLVSEEVIAEKRIEIVGDVNIILENDSYLEARQGIHVPAGSPGWSSGTNSLTIWGQNEDYKEDGAIYAVALENDAGIGSDVGDYNGVGRITINGGWIYAEGGTDYEKRGYYSSTYGAAGIGGAEASDAENITINGGVIEAWGSTDATNAGAGIGAGYRGNATNIYINRGDVTAHGGGTGYGAAGIGGGVNMTDGVYANSYQGGAGTNIYISDAIVHAYGANGANGAGAGIGGGYGGSGTNIVISNSDVTAVGGNRSGAGIGGGERNNVGDSKTYGGDGTNIRISGSMIQASGGGVYPVTSGYGSDQLGGAAIGAGRAGYADGIRIEDSTIEAIGGYRAAAIGGAYNSSSVGDITIVGGSVSARSEYGTGIGGGYGIYGNSVGNILIKDVTVEYVSGWYGAGIGGASAATIQSITLDNTDIEWAESKFAIAIGSDSEGKVGNITIANGSVVNAYGGYGGIGGGAKDDSYYVGPSSVSIEQSTIQMASGDKFGIGGAGGSSVNIKDSYVTAQCNADWDLYPAINVTPEFDGFRHATYGNDSINMETSEVVEWTSNPKDDWSQWHWVHIMPGVVASFDMQDDEKAPVVKLASQVFEIIDGDIQGGMIERPHPDPHRMYHDFIDWYTDPMPTNAAPNGDGTADPREGTIWDFVDSIDGDITLYAHWAFKGWGCTDDGAPCTDETCMCESADMCHCDPCGCYHCGVKGDYTVSFVDPEADPDSNIIDRIRVPKGVKPTRDILPSGERIPYREGKVLAGYVDDEGRDFGDVPITKDTQFRAVWADEDEVTVFHRLEGTQELQVGAHYVMVAKGAGEYKRSTLSADNFDLGNHPASGLPADGSSSAPWPTDPNDPYFTVGSTVLVNQPDPDTLLIRDVGAQNVLVSTSRLISSEDKGTVRLQTLLGNKLKLGIDSKQYSYPMFNGSGGEINLVYMDGTWNVNNSGRALRATQPWTEMPDDMYDGDMPEMELPDFIDPSMYMFNISGYRSEDIGYDIEIWTDAKPGVDLGDARYIEYPPLGLDQSQVAVDEEMLIVYTDENGDSYTLTVPNAVGSNAVEVSPVSTQDNAGVDTSVITTNRSNAWTVTTDWTTSDSSYTPDDMRSQLLQGSQYLWMSQTGMFRSVADAEKQDSATNAYFTIERGESGEIDADTRILVHGTENGRYLGWDPETNQFIGGVEKDQAINVRIYGPEKEYIFHTYYRLTDLTKLPEYSKILISLPNPWTGVPDSYLLRDQKPTEDGINWLATLNHIQNQDHVPGSFYMNRDGSITVRNTGLVEFMLGEPGETTSKRIDFEYAQIDGGSYLYPKGITDTTVKNKETVVKNYPFNTSSKKIRFEYADSGNRNEDGSLDIYLRGNSGTSWLAVKDGRYTIADTKAEAVPIRIYVISDEDPMSVIYLDAEGNEDASVTTQRYLNLRHMKDEYVPNDGIIPDETVDEVLYSFVGWSTNPGQKAFLTLAESLDIYDYDDATHTGGLKDGVAERLDLIGTGNPDIVLNIDLTDYMPEGQSALKLYPVYAVRGMDTVVTADEDGQAIVGISDWKAIEETKRKPAPQDPIEAEAGDGGAQTGSFEYGSMSDSEAAAAFQGDIAAMVGPGKDRPGVRPGDSRPGDGESNGPEVGSGDNDDLSYRDWSKEKWLGSVKVEVYKDGELWGKPDTMYFSYHNDDAVDVNIKFIWQQIIDEQYDTPEKEYYYRSLYEKLKYPFLESNPLYWYMSDTQQFPAYDQIGHFVLDGVYAEQGGSEEGLYYELNWMTDHGGQLDNVKGGSTIKVYMTSKYDVEYYLDDQLISEGNFPGEAERWTNGNTYTTKGTENLFTTDTANVTYKVTSDADGEDIRALMDPDTKTVDGDSDGVPETFKTDAMNRGEYDQFSYHIYDYLHSIPIAESPIDLVPEDRTLVSENWELKDIDSVVRDNVAWSTEGNPNHYEVGGIDAFTGSDATIYGTGNTWIAYADEEGYEAETPRTYHLYAYTEAPEREPGVSKSEKAIGSAEGVRDVTEEVVIGEDGNAAGPAVEPGNTITYNISWNDVVPAADGTIKVIDRLDAGVDFESASFNAFTISAKDDGSAVEDSQNLSKSDTDPDNVTIAYDDATHTVTWTFHNGAKHKSGTVSLTTKVNDNADQVWSYDPSDPAKGEGNADETDHSVINKAVVVGNDVLVTNDVINPLEGLFIEKIHMVSSNAGQDGYVPSLGDNAFGIPDDAKDEADDKGFTNRFSADTDQNEYKWLLTHDPGNTVRYYVKITNNTDRDLTNVVVVDPVNAVPFTSDGAFVEDTDATTVFPGIAGKVYDDPWVEGRAVSVSSDAMDVDDDGISDALDEGQTVTFTLSAAWDESWGNSSVTIEDYIPEYFDFVSAVHTMSNGEVLTLASENGSGSVTSADGTATLSFNPAGDISSVSGRGLVLCTYALDGIDDKDENQVVITLKANRNLKAGEYDNGSTACRVIRTDIVNGAPQVMAVYNKNDTKSFVRWGIPSIEKGDSEIVYFDIEIPTEGIDQELFWDNVAYVQEYDTLLQSLKGIADDDQMGVLERAWAGVHDGNTSGFDSNGNPEALALSVDSAILMSLNGDSSTAEFESHAPVAITADGIMQYEDDAEINEGSFTPTDEHANPFTVFKLDDITGAMLQSNRVVERVTPVEAEEPPEEPTEPGTGNLTVTKTVAGEGADLTQEFAFAVTLSGAYSDAEGNELDASAITGTFGDMTFTNGVSQFSLKHGDSVTATGLPAGIQFTVVEAASDGYTASLTINGVASADGTGVIADGVTVTAAFVNTFGENPPGGNPPGGNPGSGSDRPGYKPVPTPDNGMSSPTSSGKMVTTGDVLSIVGLSLLGAMGIALLIVAAIMRKRRKQG